MKRVLWISRHEMTPPQLADLERALGDTVELLLWTKTVESAEELIGPLKKADAAAAVLPAELLAELLRVAGKKPVLLAVSARRATGRTRTLPDGRREEEFVFVHRGWRQLLRLELETRAL